MSSLALPYIVNIKSLRHRSPRLAEIIEAAVPAVLDIQGSKSGEPSARIGNAWLHSRYDPVGEARNLAREAIASGAELILLLGMGFGYSARAALAEGVKVTAVEVDVSLLAALLRAVPLNDVLEDERFTLLLCPEGQGLLDYLQEVSPRTIAVMENRATLMASPEAAAALRVQAERYRRKDEINAATLRRFGRLWVRNLSRNVRTAAIFPGVAALTGVFKDMPAIVLAAGPSLDDLEGLLPALAERAVVICVDTALRSALRMGVEPDFVVVVDPQYWNYRHLDRCVSPRSILVTEAAVWPAVLRFNTRTKVFCSSLYPLGRYVEGKRGEMRGALGAGGSVATTAWDFARLIGCSPVYMAGLDLAFPDGKTHAKASLFEQRSLCESTKLQPASTALFKTMLGGNPLQAIANDGQMVASDERLSLYASWFERTIASCPATHTCTFSVRGLAIPGIPYEPPGSLMDCPPIRAEVERRLATAMDAASATDDALACKPEAEVQTIVNELISELNRLAVLADEAVRLASGCEGAAGDHDVDDILAQLSSIDEEVLGSDAREVIGFLFASAAEAVGGRARSLEESFDQTARLYRAVAESARYHATTLG
ncbi:MAG: DUF115 domain-containing protein, partial [Spirochaetales bacterium]|nr:DUF115 domain-containing protein [Spirochaetales bacterium]